MAIVIIVWATLVGFLIGGDLATNGKIKVNAHNKNHATSTIKK